MFDHAPFRGFMLLPDEARGVRLAYGTLRTGAGRIAEIEELPPEPVQRPLLLSPGFIDAHMHLPQYDSIGADGMPLLEWLERVIFPAETAWADTEAARAMSARVATNLLSFGTTSLAAYGTVHTPAVQAAIEELGHAGLSGYVGHVIMDRGGPASLTAGVSSQLQGVAGLRAVGRVMPSIAPRFALSCTMETMTTCARIAREQNLLVQTHLSETREECERVARLFGGDYTGVYERAGLLGPRSVLAHGIWLSPEERAALQRTASVVAHCPTANEFLGSGTMNRHITLEMGVRMALGSDVAGGPERAMPRVAKAMLAAAKSLGHAPPTGAAGFAHITRLNAQCLGLSDVGELRTGAAADLVVIAPDIPWVDAQDPLARLLYAWDDRWLAATLTEGFVRFTRTAF